MRGVAVLTALLYVIEMCGTNLADGCAARDNRKDFLFRIASLLLTLSCEVSESVSQ